MVMKRIPPYLLYIIICVLSLQSCADNTHEEALCQAEALMEAEQYEDAYALLDSIDGGLFHPGSRQQARYALLYTKARYKNYIVSPSDSLVSLCVDYAEADGGEKERYYAYLYQGIVRYELCDYSKSTQSLLRALANSGSIDDHYSKGQMFSYLAQVNGIQHCSDEVYYAERACEEYDRGGLGVYYANAMTSLAVAKIHQLDYDSVQVVLDEAIMYADSLEDSFSLNEALSVKAQYAISIDSFLIAAQIYDKLLNDSSYSVQCKDFCNLALLHAKTNNIDKASEYLSFARKACVNINDSLQVLVKAISVYDHLGCQHQVALLKDSLISYQDWMITESGGHTSLAFQRDYAEWQTVLSEEKGQKRSCIFLAVLAVITLLLSLLYYSYQKKTILTKLQTAKIEKLEAQIQLHSEQRESGINTIRESEIVSYFHELAIKKGTNSIKRWSELESLYNQNLPHFEKSLRELYSLSDLEWHLCMLLKLGFTPSEMSELLNRSPATISLMRSRLYFKVFNKKGTPADWDSFVKKL